jgi:hypothetical protein
VSSQTLNCIYSTTFNGVDHVLYYQRPRICQPVEGRQPASLAKTFDLWIVIARAVELAKHKANKIGRRNSFQRILEQQGLAAVLGNTESSQMSTATRLLAILTHVEEVTKWRETLTPHQRISWSAPSTVFKHCPVFRSDASERADKTALAKADRVAAGKAELTLLDHIRGAIARVSDFMDLTADEQQIVGEELDELVKELRKVWKEAREQDTIVWHKSASNFPGFSKYFDDEEGPDASTYLITPELNKAGRLTGYVVAADRWSMRAKTLDEAKALAEDHAGN